MSMSNERRDEFRFRLRGYEDYLVKIVRALQAFLILTIISGALGVFVKPLGVLFYLHLLMWHSVRLVVMSMFPSVEWADWTAGLYLLVPIMTFVEIYLLDLLVVRQD